MIWSAELNRLFQALSPGLGRILRFGLVGIAATSSYLLLMNMLLRPFLAQHAAIGNSLALGTSVAISYVGHKAFTFRSTNPVHQDLPRFLISTAIAVAACSLLFSVMVRQDFGVTTSSVCVAALYPLLSFVLHSFWTFRRA